MNKAALYIFAGLPGSGKSTLAQELSKATGATYLRIDTVEQGIRDLCHFKVQGEGYRLTYRLAADNLNLGNSVIADSCNPIQLTREEWRNVAIASGADYIDVEVVCTDKSEHRFRVETRKPTVPGLKLPTWEQVQKREYHTWHCDRIMIDTAGKSIQACLDELLNSLTKVL